MKKILSLVLASVLTVSMLAMALVPAGAAPAAVGENTVTAVYPITGMTFAITAEGGEGTSFELVGTALKFHPTYAQSASLVSFGKYAEFGSPVMPTTTTGATAVAIFVDATENPAGKEIGLSPYFTPVATPRRMCTDSKYYVVEGTSLEGGAMVEKTAVTPTATGSKWGYAPIADGFVGYIVVPLDQFGSLGWDSTPIGTLSLTDALGSAKSGVAAYFDSGSKFTIDEYSFVSIGPKPDMSLKSFTLNKSKLTIALDEVDDDGDPACFRQLSVTSHLPDPTDTDMDTITWTSSDPAVATVDADGEIEALTVGTTTITAKIGEITTTCVVTVVEDTILLKDVAEASKLVSSNDKPKAGESLQLELDFDVDPTEEFDIAWESSDLTIATVDENGVVKGLKAGTVTFTASFTDSDGTVYKRTITITFAAAAGPNTGSTALYTAAIAAVFVALAAGVLVLARKKEEN